jgi:methyltransferase-like protein
VPKAARDAVFRICGETLAANGLAAISYNVLPGWHLRSVVRDICLYHAGKDGPPRQRVAKARQALEEIAKSASETEPYGLLLRKEAERTARLPAAYILGELLTTDNAPCYFHEFVAWAGRCGLGYLGEGDLTSSISETLFPETERRIKTLAGASRLAIEQYKDFFSGRPFRRSILIKAPAAAGIERGASPERMHPLHVASKLNFDPSQSDAQVSVYTDGRGRAITARDPAVRLALARLAEHYPETLTLQQLTATDVEGAAPARAEAETRVCGALFALLAADQAIVSALPRHVGRAATERPRAWALARIEAAARQPWVTSLQHDAVPLQPVHAVLLAHLDGSNDRQSLRARLVEALRSGEVRLPEPQSDQGPIDDARLATIAAHHVEETLSYLAEHALLEPAS